MRVSYATRSPRGRLKIAMEKADLPSGLEMTQSNRLKPPMTTTTPPAIKTTAVVIRDRCARVNLSRLLLSCANVPPPNWAPPYHGVRVSRPSGIIMLCAVCSWILSCVAFMCPSFRVF